MADNFDDIDEFAEEFDFMEDDENSKNKSTSASTTSNYQKPKSKLGPILIVAVIAGGGYYGYTNFIATGNSDIKQQVSKNVKKETTKLAESIKEVENKTETKIETDVQASTKESAIQDDFVDFADELNTNTNPMMPPISMDSEMEITQALPNQNSSTTSKTTNTTNTTNSTVVKEFVIPDEVNDALDSLSEEMTMNVNQIKQLENVLDKLLNTVDQLNRNIGAMDNRILSLTETVDTLSQDLTNVKKVMVQEDLDLTNKANVKISSHDQKDLLMYSAPDYVVHAIIPGRAWLKSGSGQIITVTEGDSVGDYGKIALIDAANSIVRTSSGITFR